MIQREGWHYIQIGRSIERAAATATMLEVHFDDTASAVRDGGIGAYVSWAALLRSCSAFEAYCQRYTADVRPERVAEFLLLNADFPRSVRFAVDTRRGVAAGRRAGARAQFAPGASIASPAGCGRRSTTARSTRSWPTACRATCRAFAGSASRCTRRFTRPTSAIRRNRRSAPMSGDIQYVDPAHESIHLQRAHQREHDGGAHAAAQRRPAALPALRADDAAAGARVRVSGFARERRASLRHSRAGTRGSAITADAVVDMAPAPAIPGQPARTRRGTSSTRSPPPASGGRACSSATSRARRRCSVSSRTSSGGSRDADPLTLMRRLNYALFHAFTYAPSRTTSRFADRRGAEGARGRVPGLRAHHDCARAAASAFRAATSAATCRRASDEQAMVGGGCDARVGRSVLPTLGWVGFDPDQRHAGGRAAHRAWPSAATTRMCRRRAACFEGEARQRAGGAGHGVAVRRADSPDRVLPMTTWVAPEVAEPPSRSITRSNSSSNNNRRVR